MGESGLMKLQFVVAVLQRCHRAFSHAMDETRFLTDFCEILVTLAGYRYCWIGCSEKGNPDLIRPVARHGAESPDPKSGSLSFEESGLGTDALLANVMETRAPFCIQHLSAKKSPASVETWRINAVSKGYQSALLLPLIEEDNEKAIGILGLYSDDPTGFNDDETALLTLLSRDIATIVRHLSKEDGHPRPDSLQANHDETIGLQNADLFFDH